MYIFLAIYVIVLVSELTELESYWMLSCILLYSLKFILGFSSVFVFVFVLFFFFGMQKFLARDGTCHSSDNASPLTTRPPENSHIYGFGLDLCNQSIK